MDSAAGSSQNNLLSLLIQGRATACIVDPQGRKSGIDPETGLRVDEIPEAKISIDQKSGAISVENAPDGTYTLQFKGGSEEDCRLNLSYMNANDSQSANPHVFLHTTPASFSFSINSAATNKLTINHTPLPPANLQADAVGTGGLTTRLTWTASSDPLVTGYTIYAKNYDEPYLAQVGTATGATYDTGDPWAADATVKTRIYAVSAIKSDGTESFLSTTSQNDDRDRDGLTDTDEAIYNTNPVNPDSDADGLKDGEEIIHGTDPLKKDTDGDTYSDYLEVQRGTDPLDPASYPITVTLTANPVSPRPPGPVISFSAQISDGSGTYEYQYKLRNPAGVWSTVRAYTTAASWTWNTAGLATGTYKIEVWARKAGSTAAWEAFTNMGYTLSPPASAVTLTANAASPRPVSAQVTFTAAASGGSGAYEYQFKLRNPAGVWSVGRAYAAAPSWTWNTTGLAAGAYKIEVWARNSGSTAAWEAYKNMSFSLAAPASAVTLTPNAASPQSVGNKITFTAAASGGSGSYVYQFRLRTPSGVWSVARDYSSTPTWTWSTTAAQAAGSYLVEVWAKNTGSNALQEVYRNKGFLLQ